MTNKKRKQRRARQRMINAGQDKSAQMNIAASFGIEAAADGEEKKARRFNITAYTGDKMRLAGWWEPVVIELSGIDISAKNIPIFLGHNGDVENVFGQTDKVEVVGSDLVATGLVLGESQRIKDAIALADNGFQWQASVGAAPTRIEYIKAGESITINGKKMDGPVNVARKSILKEISFVPIGADNKTSAKIAATYKESDMDFQEWLEAKGFDPETISDDQKKSLQAAYDAEMKLEASGTDLTPEPVPAPKIEATGELTDGEKAVNEIRAAAAGETSRIAAITAACGGNHPKIEAKAIGEGWDETKTELEVLRAERPQAPAAHIGSSASGSPKAMEAACIMAGGVDGNDLIESYGQQVVEAADKNYRRIGLQQLFMEAAWMNGSDIRQFRGNERQVMQAAFSNNTLSGLLSNVANKFLLSGFNAVESAWRQVCSIRSVPDFKQATSYSLTGDFKYVEVAPSGELAHATAGAESYTNQAKTYGRMFSVSRTDLVNDDLNALTSVPTKIGRGGALELNLVFWTAFMANSSFYTTGNSNLIEGTTSVLSIAALTAADQAFMEQTDPDGNPLGIMPKIILSPPATKVTGMQLVNDTLVNETTTANKPKPSNNPHAGNFTAVASAYLANSSITGYSSTAWYLLADPKDLSTVEVAFLNGQQTPTVEQADANFDTLGVQFRGYFDFGVALQEPRAGQKSTGVVAA